MRLAWREALLAFRRAPVLSALSVTTIAFSLFAFGLFGLVALNIRKALSQVEERVEIRAFVIEGEVGQKQRSTALGDIAAFPEVASAKLTTPEQALARAPRELPASSLTSLRPASLPASIDVRRLQEGHLTDPVRVKAVAERIKSYDFVDDVRFGEEWVQKLYRIRTIATHGGRVLRPHVRRHLQ